MFACGLQGYTDDRLADGEGWVRCPRVPGQGDQ
jgi:hypothetical protein